MRSLSQLRYVGWISFFQYLFLIPLLLGTLKNTSSTGFPLRFKGTWDFYGVLPRLPEAHTRTPSSGAVPSRKDTFGLQRFKTHMTKSCCFK